MAWNEPGNGKDPWKSGGNNQPPDLDEVYRRLQAKLKSLFGGGGGKRSSGSGGGGGFSNGILWIVGLVLTLWVVIGSVYIIDEPERGVVLRFGQYAKTMQPGFNLTLPPPIDIVHRVDVDNIRSEVAQGAMLTRDENIVIIETAVQYRVKDAEAYLFKVREPDETLEQSAESAMRQVIGDNDMDFVLLEGRASIGADIRQLLQEILDRYETGLEVTAVNLQEVRPPPEVKDAFDDAITAREDRERATNEANAYKNRILPVSRGDAERIRRQADAYKAEVVARAQGESQRFTQLHQEYLLAPDVTRQRLYLETMEEVLGQSNKVLVDVDQGNNVMYLPLDRIMQATAPALSARGRETSSGVERSPAPEIDFRSRDATRRGRDGN